MKYGRSIGILVAAIVLAACSSVYANPSDEDSDNKAKFTFALWGDTPYSAAELGKIPALTAEINDSKVAFSVFVGDIKSGSTLCTNDQFSAAIARFDEIGRAHV